MRSSFVNLIALATFVASFAPAMAQETNYPAPLLPLQFQPINNAILGAPSTREVPRGLLPIQFRPLPDQTLTSRQVGDDIASIRPVGPEQYQSPPYVNPDEYQSPPFVNPDDLPAPASKRQFEDGSSPYASPPIVNPADFPPANAPRPNIQVGRRDDSLAPILGNGVVAGINANIANSKGQDIFTDNQRREMRELYVDPNGGNVYVNVDGADTFVQRSISDLDDDELLAIMIRMSTEN